MIPESLGNSALTLRPGVVCDGCNNYFSREVERPFLASGAITYLRFAQAVQSKKGKIPSVEGVLDPGFPAQLYRTLDTDMPMIVSLPPLAIEHLFTARAGRLTVPTGGDPPPETVLSRFLAKVALEAMAARLARYPDGLDYLVSEAQLDPIRNHARRGSTPRWPVSVRRIYDGDAGVSDEAGTVHQVVHESDILVTESGEWYFVLAIFGLELAINYAGPTIHGYDEWIKAHDGVSPLYAGRNAGAALPKRIVDPRP